MTNPTFQEAELFAGSGNMEVPRAEALPADASEAASAIEPHILLINALGNLRQASRLNGYITVSTRDIDSSNRAAIKRIQNVRAKRGQHTTQAQSAYSEAIELLYAQGATTEELQELGINSLTAFIKNNYGPHKHKENIALSRLIRQEAERRSRDLETAVTSVNREHGLRPHKPEPATADKELEKLGKRTRMEVVQNDPRAGFLPATHREKGRVVIFLDYLDNRDYPFGVNDQLKEVFLKVKRENDGDVGEGMRAVESIAWELCDYLQDAALTHQQLVDLRTDALDVRPDVKVVDDELANHPGMERIISYLSRLEWMEFGEVNGLGRDPLRSTEERWTHQGEGRHKIVRSPFTRPDRTQTFEKYIEKRKKTLTFSEVKWVIDEAIDNEVHRMKFMARRLKEMEIYSGYPEAVQDAIDEGLNSLASISGLQLASNEHLGRTT